MSSRVRSIDHCVELLASLKAHEKQTEDAAEKGLVLVARWLLKLRKDLKDRQSRLDTQLGSHHAMDGVYMLVILMWCVSLGRISRERRSLQRYSSRWLARDRASTRYNERRPR